MATVALPSLWPVPRRLRSDVLRIAHRGGASGGAPYGVANLRRLGQLGVHLLEFDIRTTLDDELVVAHDPSVVDGAGEELRIDEHSLEELRAVFGGRSEALDVRGVVGRARDAGLGLYVDVKTLTPGSASALARVIDREGMAGRTILASADPSVVTLFARAAPELPRSILFVAPDVDAVGLARSVDAHFVHPCWESLVQPHRRLQHAGWLDELRHDERGIVTWHVESQAVVEGLFAVGVDGICTDAPGLLTSMAEAATES